MKVENTSEHDRDCGARTRRSLLAALRSATRMCVELLEGRVLLAGTPLPQAAAQFIDSIPPLIFPISSDAPPNGVELPPSSVDESNVPVLGQNNSASANVDGSSVSASFDTANAEAAPAVPKIVWKGAQSGDWDVPTNWSEGRLPAADDIVEIDLAAGQTVTLLAATANIPQLTCNGNLAIVGGTLSIANTSQITNLILSSGELGGSGDLTVSGSMTWSAGTMSGTGKTIAAGLLAITGTENKYLGRVLENRGVANYSGTLLSLGYPAAGTINNAAGAKSGTGATIIGVEFNNSGTVDLSGGTLTINANAGAVGVSGSSTGTMTVQAGTTLNLGGIFSFTGSGGISGAGTVNFMAGTQTFAGNFAITSAW